MLVAGTAAAAVERGRVDLADTIADGCSEGRAEVGVDLESALAPQRPGGAQEDVDPYTRGDEAAMRRAGYVSFGPFTWGDDHDTRAIDEIVGSTRIRWIESEHFKLGCALAPYAVPREQRAIDKLEGELKRLGKKLPRVKSARPKELDGWLRAHLLSQRLEELYADFLKHTGFTARDFPTEAVATGDATSGTQPKGGAASTRFGHGPHLGQRDKYLVLVFEKSSDMGRYLRRFLKMDQDMAMRMPFIQAGSMFFGTAAEYGEGTFRSDTALQCNITFNVVHNLVDGLGGYRHDVPVWCKEGLAHWFLRRIDERFPSFSQVKDAGNAAYQDTDWAEKVRARVGFDHYTRAGEMLQRFDYSEMTFEDHMMVWSRIDWAMAQGPARVRTFLHLLKGRIDDGSAVATHAQVVARQEQALREAFGVDAAGLDAAWSRWVLATYPK